LLRRGEKVIDGSTHRKLILEQFTQQAEQFQATQLSAETAIKRAIEFSGVGPTDTVLDVACGPGVLACAFGEVAQHVTGIDITPTMLEHAQRLQAAKNLKNVDWKLGDVSTLPFEANGFSLVISRYAVHHFQSPVAVVSEMSRVCSPDGRVLLIDSAPSVDKSEEFNRVERMRDPSHTQAFTQDGLKDLMHQAGLTSFRSHLYAWEVAVQGLLERSFPNPADEAKLWKLYESDVGLNNIGMNARYLDGKLHVTFPTLILVGSKGSLETMPVVLK
jgi:ubiquinone/menaquinone biosynthesis C-methylase UbiE